MEGTMICAGCGREIAVTYDDEKLCGVVVCPHCDTWNAAVITLPRKEAQKRGLAWWWEFVKEKL